MEITLVAPDEICNKCTTMYSRLENVRTRYPEINLKKVSFDRHSKEFLNYSTPILMIDDCVISSGKVIPEDFLDEYIKTQLSYKTQSCQSSKAQDKTGQQPDMENSAARWHILPYKDKYLALDINTSRCLEIDEYANKIFQGETARNAAMEEVIKEYNTLQYMDYFAHEKFSREIPESEAVVRSINLTIPDKCNLKCEYCYSTEHFHPSKEQIFRIIDRIIERFVIPKENKRFIFNFSLFGEVLLCVPLLKELKEYLKHRGELIGKKLASRFNATNATLLNPEKARELWELSDMGEINISIDGPQHIQDEVRHFPNGEGTYRIIEKNVEDCSSKWPAVASAVLNGHKPNVTEVFLHLYKLGFRLIRIKPIRAGDDNRFAITKDNIDRVKEEYTNFIQFLISRDDSTLLKYMSCIDGDDLFGRFFFTILKGVVTKYRCPALKDTIVVNSKGDIYSCQSVIGFKEFKVGNIFDDETGWNEKRHILLDKIHVHQKDDCTKCWARNICGGGCIHCAWLRNKSFNTPDHIECELTKHTIELAMILLAEMRSRQLLSDFLNSSFRSRGSRVVVPSTVCAYTNTSPLENPSAWEKGAVINLNRKAQLRGAANGKQDFTGNVSTLWDKQYFYIKANLVNAGYVSAENLQENLVRFCLKNDSNCLPWEYGIGLDKGKPVLYRMYMKDSTKDFFGYVDKANVSITKAEGSMIYQAAVPWEELGIKPEQDTSLGFNVVLYEREHPYPFVAKWWWEWAPGMVVEMNPNLFGRLTFGKE